MSISLEEKTKKQIEKISSVIAETQELINANDKKFELINKQIEQEKNEEKRRILYVEFMKITRESLSMQEKQFEFSKRKHHLMKELLNHLGKNSTY